MTTHLAVAMACEAKPLLSQFGLRRATEATAFPVYRGDDVALVVTGVGCIAAAAGVGYLAGLTGAGRGDPWINVGVGGHRELSVGTVVLAHEVRDAASGRTTYPPRALVEELSSIEVLTVAEVERRYEEDVVYEMEAAAFLTTARRFAIGELVQVLKIISDGPASPADELDPDRISRLVESCLPAVANLVRLLDAAALPEPRDLGQPEAALAGWRFTVSQSHRLAELRRRWRALALASDPQVSIADTLDASIADVVAELPPGAKAGELLEHLEAWVSRMPVILSRAAGEP